MKTNLMRLAPRGARILAGLALGLMATCVMADGSGATPESGSLAMKLAPATAHRLVNKWCSACHGWYGRSIHPTFPMLAGQSAEYIATQLKNFHNLTQDDRAVTHETMFEQWIINITGTRNNYRYEDAPRNEFRAWDFMKGVARDLDPPTMQALGEYYSKQTPWAGRPSKIGNAEHGKQLYLEGDASRGLIACQSCHGPDAHGQGPIPRLAGQHADYVKLQLGYIQSGVRSVEQMQALIANLNEADFRDLAAYVQSLN